MGEIDGSHCPMFLSGIVAYYICYCNLLHSFPLYICWYSIELLKLSEKIQLYDVTMSSRRFKKKNTTNMQSLHYVRIEQSFIGFGSIIICLPAPSPSHPPPPPQGCECSKKPRLDRVKLLLTSLINLAKQICYPYLFDCPA